MIKGIGIDILEIDRVREAVEDFGIRFLKRVYTDAEIKYCQRLGKYKFPELAARFAAKEAYAKAIGTGMTGIGWTDIEVRNNAKGKPFLQVKKKPIKKAHLTLSHNHTQATAVVVLEK